MEALKNFLVHLAMYASVALLFLFVFGLLAMLYDFARVLFGFGPRRRTLAERLTNRTKGDVMDASLPKGTKTGVRR